MRAIVWLSVVLCFAETGLRSHAYCALLGCDSKYVAEASDGRAQAMELLALDCGCRRSVCQSDKLPTDTDNLTYLPRVSGEGMPVCPCSRNCWCRQVPLPQVLTDTAAWNQFQQQTIPSTAVVTSLVVNDAAFRSVSAVAPASLSTASDLCATLCRYLA